MARYAALSEEYAAMPDKGRRGRGYTRRALAVFPRYNVAEAMRVEVERLDADRLPELRGLVPLLLRAAAEAQSPSTVGAKTRVERQAVAEERALFSDFVRTWRPDAAGTLLPYRRVLGPEEAAAWWAKVSARWGVLTGSWYPLLPKDVPADVLVLDDDCMWDGDGPAVVRRILADNGAQRVAELREYGPEYLVDVGLLELVYNGAEGLWTDQSLGWLAYASHEGTLALGGTSGAALRQHWPSVDRWVWSGW